MARIQDSTFFLNAIKQHCEEPLSSSLQQRALLSSSHNVEALLLKTQTFKQAQLEKSLRREPSPDPLQASGPVKPSPAQDNATFLQQKHHTNTLFIQQGVKNSQTRAYNSFQHNRIKQAVHQTKEQAVSRNRKAYNDMLCFIKKQQALKEQQHNYTQRRLKPRPIREQPERSLFHQERALVADIFNQWNKTSNGLHQQELVRQLLNNIQVLEMFNKNPETVEQELKNICKDTLCRAEELYVYLKQDSEREWVLQEYQKAQEASIGARHNLCVLEEDTMQAMRQALWEMDEEGTLEVDCGRLIKTLSSLDYMDQPAVLVTNFRQVKSLGQVLQELFINRQGQTVSLLQFLKYFSHHDPADNLVFLDQLQPHQLLFPQSYIDLHEQDPLLYDLIIGLWDQQYKYDGVYADKLKLVQDMQEQLYPHMRDVVYSAPGDTVSLEEVVVQLVDMQALFIDRDTFMSLIGSHHCIYGNRLHQCSPESQREVLRAYGLYQEYVEPESEPEEQPEPEWQKYSLEKEESDEEEQDLKRERRRERAKLQQSLKQSQKKVLNKNVTQPVEEFSFQKRAKTEKIIERRLKEELQQKQSLVEQEEEEALQHKIVLKPVPEHVRDRNLYGSMVEYKEHQRQNTRQLKETQRLEKKGQFGFYERHMQENKEKQDNLRLERERTEKVVAPFKAGHMAYTSKYDMYWQMKQEKEEKRRETRRAREQALLASVRPIGRLEERMIANNLKKEQQYQAARQQEKDSLRFENAIGRSKPIPNFQRQWQLFDRQMQQHKDQYKASFENKFGNLKPVRQEKGKLVIPVKDELDEINQQIRLNQDKKDKQRRLVEKHQSEMQPPIRQTKKSFAMEQKKKQERQTKQEQEEKEMRDQQFKLFRKMIFAPRVWNSQALGSSQVQGEPQDQVQRSQEVQKQLREQQRYNAMSHSRMMAKMMERVQQRPLMMEDYRMDYSKNLPQQDSEQPPAEGSEHRKSMSQQMNNHNISEIRNNSQMANIMEDEEEHEAEMRPEEEQEIKIDDQEIDKMESQQFSQEDYEHMLAKQGQEDYEHMIAKQEQEDYEHMLGKQEQEEYDHILAKQEQEHSDQVVQHPPSQEDYHRDGAAVEEEALQRMQILANMSDLEKMDEQQLYEHYEFLKMHGYINDDDIQHHKPPPEDPDYFESRQQQFNNSL